MGSPPARGGLCASVGLQLHVYAAAAERTALAAHHQWAHQQGAPAPLGSSPACPSPPPAAAPTCHLPDAGARRGAAQDVYVTVSTPNGGNFQVARVLPGGSTAGTPTSAGGEAYPDSPTVMVPPATTLHQSIGIAGRKL